MTKTYLRSALQKPPPTMPPPGIPVVDLANKGGLGVLELRKNPPEDVQVTAIIKPGYINPGDTLFLYWDGEEVDSYTIEKPQSDTGFLLFNVHPQYILDTESARVEYSSFTAPVANEATSFPYFVRVKTTVPGDPDPVPATPVLNENLAKPNGIPAIIDDAVANNGITVTIVPWIYMDVGDVLTLTWGQTQIKLPSITQDQVGKPISVPVDRATILATSNTLGLRVFYDIRDVVGNWSLQSLPAITDVEAGANNLPPPRVREAAGDNDINLTELGLSNAHVDIPIYSPWSIGDSIVLHWVGKTAGGVAVEQTVTYVTRPDDEGWPISLEIDNANVVALAGGSAIVYYEVNNLHRSRRLSITVSGAIQKLPPPDVREQVGGVLDPANVTAAGATVIVPAYAGMNSTDKIVLYWTGTTAGGGNTSYTAEKPGNNNNQDVIFNVPKAQHVDILAGGSVSLYYHVVTAQGIGRDSDPLPLSVKAGQPDPGLDLRRPEVPKAYGANRDHLNFASAMYNDDYLVVTVGYTGMAIGQRVRLNWGATVPYTTELPVTTIGTIQFQVPRLEVVDMIGRTVAITYTVTLANGNAGGTSDPLSLIIDSQSRELTAPRMAIGNQTAIIQYTGMSSPPQTVRIAWWGVSTHYSDDIAVNGATSVSVPIPASWRSENVGRLVLVNYTTHVIGSGTGTLEFSRVLRLQL